MMPIPVLLPARRAAAIACLGFLMALGGQNASAYTVGIAAGTRVLYLQVGVGTANANNATVNMVSGTVTGLTNGNGTSLVLTTNSTFTNSFIDNYPVCSTPNQVYVGGFYRTTAAAGAGAPAVLTVSTPTNLTNGAFVIPFTSISWVSTENPPPGAPTIPSGTFTGGVQTLVSIARNTWQEQCFTFSYSNGAIRRSGTYLGTATYTLTAP